jgi:hypothetical protein
MKRLVLLTPALALVVGLFTMLPLDACASGSCGLPPLKPLVPLGCDDLVAQCRCDAQGLNCRWEWVCVKRR